MLSNESSENSSDFSSVLGEKSGAGDGNGENSGDMDFDFSKLLKVRELLSGYNKKDQNTEFLYALKPILKDENQVKVDKVVKILKLLALWPLIKDSGLLGGDLFDFL